MTNLRTLFSTMALLLVAQLATAQTTAHRTGQALSRGSSPSAAGRSRRGTISVDWRRVTLPVTVRDKKGKIVSGLTRDDFELQEDGKPQTIKSFSLDTHLPLTLGLAVDTSESLRDGLDQERAASKSFFETMLTAPNDKAFLLHFDRSSGRRG